MRSRRSALTGSAVALLATMVVVATALLARQPTAALSHPSSRAPLAAPQGVNGTYNNFEMVNTCSHPATGMRLTLVGPGLTITAITDTYQAVGATGWTAVVTSPAVDTVVITWSAGTQPAVPTQGIGHFGYAITSGTTISSTVAEWLWAPNGSCKVSAKMLVTWFTAMGSSAAAPQQAPAVLARITNLDDRPVYVRRWATIVTPVLPLPALRPSNEAIIRDTNLIDRRWPILLMGGEMLDHVFATDGRTGAAVLAFTVSYDTGGPWTTFDFSELGLVGKTELTPMPPGRPPREWQLLLPSLFRGQ